MAGQEGWDFPSNRELWKKLRGWAKLGVVKYSCPTLVWHSESRKSRKIVYQTSLLKLEWKIPFRGFAHPLVPWNTCKIHWRLSSLPYRKGASQGLQQDTVSGDYWCCYSINWGSRAFSGQHRLQPCCLSWDSLRPCIMKCLFWQSTFLSSPHHQVCEIIHLKLCEQNLAVAIRCEEVPESNCLSSPDSVPFLHRHYL